MVEGEGQSDVVKATQEALLRFLKPLGGKDKLKATPIATGMGAIKKQMLPEQGQQSLQQQQIANITQTNTNTRK